MTDTPEIHPNSMCGTVRLDDGREVPGCHVEHEHDWIRRLCDVDEHCGCGATRTAPEHVPAPLLEVGLWVDVDGHQEPTLWNGDLERPTAVLRRCDNPAIFDAVQRALEFATKLDFLAKQHRAAGNEDRATAYAGAAAGIRSAMSGQGKAHGILAMVEQLGPQVVGPCVSCGAADPPEGSPTCCTTCAHSVLPEHQHGPGCDPVTGVCR